jgi:hypothetical protein
LAVRTVPLRTVLRTVPFFSNAWHPSFELAPPRSRACARLSWLSQIRTAKYQATCSVGKDASRVSCIHLHEERTSTRVRCKAPVKGTRWTHLVVGEEHEVLVGAILQTLVAHVHENVLDLAFQRVVSRLETVLGEVKAPGQGDRHVYGRAHTCGVNGRKMMPRRVISASSNTCGV